MSLLKDKIELEIEEAELNTQKAVMGFPRAFRWFLAAFIIAVIPVYFVSKSISQTIWLKRYQQGALTAKPSFTNPKAPVVGNITVTTFKQGSYAAVLQITNPNFNLSLDKVPYRVNFFNSQKQQIYSYPDTLYLLPDQTKYLTVPTFPLSDAIAFSSLALPDNIALAKPPANPERGLNYFAARHFLPKFPAGVCGHRGLYQ